MRAAFKEWAVVVDALERGEQIIILRKGGISEGVGGFKVDHPQFLLFPTLFHQQRESVIESAQRRYDEIASQFPSPDRVRISSYATLSESKQLTSLENANALGGQHVWRAEVISDRFDWGRTKELYALAVRVYRLRQVIELPMLPAYAGSRSWIELTEEVSIEGAEPVLSEGDFQEKLSRFRAALSDVPTVAESQSAS